MPMKRWRWSPLRRILYRWRSGAYTIWLSKLYEDMIRADVNATARECALAVLLARPAYVRRR